MYNIELRRYRRLFLKSARYKLFRGCFESINEKIENVLIELPGLLGSFVMSFLGIVLAVIILITVPLWVPVYVCIKIIERAYIMRRNMKFYNKCGGNPFNMFNNRD